MPKSKTLSQMQMESKDAAKAKTAEKRAKKKATKKKKEEVEYDASEE